jgi:Thiolase, C-terminal domain
MRQSSKSDSRPSGPGWNREHQLAPGISYGPAVSRFRTFKPTLARAFKPTLAWAKDTGADLAKTNVNGGAIAIGHPLGASGARIMTTMVNALEQRGGRYALQTMCEGGGMANATIIERLD